MLKRLSIGLLSAALLLAAVPDITTATELEAKASCKDGAWQGLVRADGSAFKNQGECVSYAARGGTPGTPLPSGPRNAIQELCEAYGGTYVDDHSHQNVGEACVDSQAGASAVFNSPELCSEPQITYWIDDHSAGCVVLSQP